LYDTIAYRIKYIRGKDMAANKFKESLSRNYRYIIVGGLFLVLVIVLIVFLATRGTDVAESSNDSGDLNAITTSIEVPKDKMEKAESNVETICTNYMNAMSTGDSATMASLSNALSDERRVFFEVQAQYMGNYSNYEFYTKVGPADNSFLVLAKYTLHIIGDATELPALCSLYVCTDESGNLYINNADLSQDEEAYILALASQDDFKKLQEGVQVEYNELLEKNPEVSAEVTKLRGEINADVQEKLEAKKKAETEAAAEAAAQEAAAAAAAAATQVKATTEVNIRASASTEADSLGKAQAGQQFTRYEVMENGWSRIDYNGQEAYIKTEYLEDITDAATEGEEQAQTAREAGSTITVKENVNIRAQANTDSDILGKASAGDTYTLIEEVNGWCKFTYDGKDAYIRSDFIK